MELREAVLGRRCIRRFKKDPVPRKVIEEIFDYALWAPSGMNRQNWYFVVLTGKEREKIIPICKKAFYNHLKQPLEKVFAKFPKVIRDTEKFFSNLGGAPVVILAYAEPGPYGESTDIQSVSAAIQNLLLLAYEKGLGTCWMTGPVSESEEINKVFKIEGKKLITIIPMGYPDEKPIPPKRKSGKVEYRGFAEVVS